MLKSYFSVALQKFGYDPTQSANVFIFDEYNTPISPEMFPIVVKQYIDSSSFYLKLVFTMDENSGFDMAS